MSVRELASPRLEMVVSPESVDVVIAVPPARQQYLAAGLVLSAWCTSGALCVEALLHLLVAGATPLAASAALYFAWLVGFAWMLVAGRNILRYQIAGLSSRETIHIEAPKSKGYRDSERGRAVVKRAVMGVGPTRTFELSQLRNLRLTEDLRLPVERPWSLLQERDRADPGRIAFDLDEKTIRFASGIDDGDAMQIIQAIERLR